MKVTMEQIVFNAESTLPKGMLEACTKAMYPFVDEIIICEGATMAVRDGCTAQMTRTGSSVDRTVERIMSIPDPQRKIRIIAANGFWESKTRMMNECDRIATGDYVWQVDSDEFYQEKDIERILKILDGKRPDEIDFFAYHFWGGYDTYVPFSEKLWGNDIPWRRIFKRDGFFGKWKTHEPPNYVDRTGASRSNGNVMHREQTAEMGLALYHYGFVVGSQIKFKQEFYQNPNYKPMWEAWHRDNRAAIINGSHTVNFNGQHPKAIRDLIGK